MSGLRKCAKTARKGKTSLFAAILILFVAAPVDGNAQTSNSSTRLKLISPDQRFTARISSSGKRRAAKADESGVEIRDGNGRLLCTHDFSSSDGEHGYGVDGAKWTPNSQFLVLRVRSSGGHSPMFAPVVFWSRKTGRFYQLNDYTSDQLFSVSSPDNVEVSSWSDFKPVTVSLSALRPNQLSKLR